jgi:CspA family cold shock protein
MARVTPFCISARCNRPATKRCLPEPPRRVAPDPSTAVSVSGKVKWFDENKGFGFVQSNDGGKDVFVHISVLSSSGVTRLMEGQPVTMRVVDTPKGREALSITAE